MHHSVGCVPELAVLHPDGEGADGRVRRGDTAHRQQEGEGKEKF